MNDASKSLTWTWLNGEYWNKMLRATQLPLPHESGCDPSSVLLRADYRVSGYGPQHIFGSLSAATFRRKHCSVTDGWSRSMASRRGRQNPPAASSELIRPARFSLRQAGPPMNDGVSRTDDARPLRTAADTRSQHKLEQLGNPRLYSSRRWMLRTGIRSSLNFLSIFWRVVSLHSEVLKQRGNNSA